MSMQRGVNYVTLRHLSVVIGGRVLVGGSRSSQSRGQYRALGLVLVMGLLALAQGCFRTLGSPVESTLSGPTCESAYQIAEWSLERTPSEKPSSLSEPAFIRKVLTRYVELVDPNKLLFLESEVDRFVSDGMDYWERFVADQDCGGFEEWHSAAIRKTKSRLTARLGALPLEKQLPEVLPTKTVEEKNYPWFLSYAKSEKELDSRLEKFARSIGESANQAQLDAFSGNRRELVRFTLSRLVLEEAPSSPVHLMIRSLVGALDPFSDYFSREEYADFYRDLTGGTSGIGVKVREVPAGLLVQSVLPDSPAGKSRMIHSGDTIVTVDGQALSTLPAEKLRHVLEGEEFTTVDLTVAPRAGKASRKVRLVRRSFAFEDARVESRIVHVRSRPNRRVGVITIPSFYGRGGSGGSGERSSAEDVQAALLKVLKKKPAAVVLDLRGNPGGYLEEAVSMAGLFLGNRPVVAVVEPKMRRILRDFHARALYTGPLLVLVDDQSASASEVLAGALKDYQRAIVLGAPATYGKGSVQRLFHLDTGLIELAEEDRQGVLKLTTSFFYSPLGHTPANGGISPHISLGTKQEKKSAKPKRRQSVPELSPFVDGPTLNAIRMQERVVEARVAALKQSSAVRAEDVRAVFDQVVRKAFGAGSSEEDSPRRESMVETLAIAEDLVGMERAAKEPSPSQKSPSDTELH